MYTVACSRRSIFWTGIFLALDALVEFRDDFTPSCIPTNLSLDPIHGPTAETLIRFLEPLSSTSKFVSMISQHHSSEPSERRSRNWNRLWFLDTRSSRLRVINVHESTPVSIRWLKRKSCFEEVEITPLAGCAYAGKDVTVLAQSWPGCWLQLVECSSAEIPFRSHALGIRMQVRRAVTEYAVQRRVHEMGTFHAKNEGRRPSINTVKL